MMARTPDEIRAEIKRLESIIAARDKVMASFGAEPSANGIPEAMIHALTWALGEVRPSAARGGK
jgi:hypothetical protein